MTKPHAEIREALVTGIRNNPEKSPALKHAAEVLIGVIDANGTDDAFLSAYATFKRAAAGEPFRQGFHPARSHSGSGCSMTPRKPTSIGLTNMSPFTPQALAIFFGVFFAFVAAYWWFAT